MQNRFALRRPWRELLIEFLVARNDIGFDTTVISVLITTEIRLFGYQASEAVEVRKHVRNLDRIRAELVKRKVAAPL